MKEAIQNLENSRNKYQAGPVRYPMICQKMMKDRSGIPGQGQMLALV